MSVTTYSKCGGLMGSYVQSMTFTPYEPYPWDYLQVASQDANGNPLVVNFYLGDSLQFVRTYTYDADSNITSLTIT